MSRDPNDDRSDTLNPNNDAHAAAEANEERQHGGDWEYDDNSDDADNVETVRELKLHMRPMELKDDADPGRIPPSLRQICGPMVVDRQSHFWCVVMSILNMSWGYKFEDPESADARKKKLATISDLIAKADQLKGESYGNMTENDKSLYSLGHELRFYMKYFCEKGDYQCRFRERNYEGPPTEYLVPRPRMVSCGWRELYDWLSKNLITALIQADRRPCAIIFKTIVWTHDNFRSVPDPGEFSHRVFGSNEEAWCLADETTAEKEKAKLERNRLGDNNASQHVWVFPKTAHDASVVMTVERCQRSLDIVRWLLAPYPDWWDIRPVLNELVIATQATEWAERPLCVFGVTRAELKQHCASLSARRIADAASLRHAIAQRGLRTIILETPTVSGTVTSAKPCSSSFDDDKDTPLAQNKRVWSLCRVSTTLENG